jgi:hypothetical protein
MMSTERRLSKERYQVFMQQSFTSERETGSLRMLPKASALLLFGTREVDKPGERKISYKLKGKPTTLADVSIHTYGSADSCLEAAGQSLKLKAGETYLRQNADQSAASMEKACSRPGMWTEVTEADRLTADGRLQVVFNVLTFPLQTVLVDGVAVDSVQ